MTNSLLPRLNSWKTIFTNESANKFIDSFSSLYLVLSQIQKKQTDNIDLDLNLVECFKDNFNQFLLIKSVYTPENTGQNLIVNLDLLELISEFKDKPLWDDSIEGFNQVKYNRKKQGIFLNKLFPILKNKDVFLAYKIAPGVKFSINNQLKFTGLDAEICFEVLRNKTDFEARPFIKISNYTYSFYIDKLSFWLIKISGNIYKWKDYETAELFNFWGDKKSISSKLGKYKFFFSEIIFPLSLKYDVIYRPELQLKFGELVDPNFKFFLKIEDDILKILPVVGYKYDQRKIELNIDFQKVETRKIDSTYHILKRNEEIERMAFNDVLFFDKRLEYNNSAYNFYIKIDDIGKEWIAAFIKVIESKSNAYQVYYVAEYGESATIKQEFISGIDWLDKLEEIKYSEHDLDFKDLIETFLYKTKNAVLTKQEKKEFLEEDNIFINEDWRRKYEILQNDIPEYDIPFNIKADLHDYQIEGYRWLKHLTECQIGGILADDMGLGKTLQILTLLQSFKNEKGHVFALIVVPKSILFNWENEKIKFANNLTLHKYYGLGRNINALEIKKFNIIVTTYQTLVKDVRKFQCIDFDFLILDESQNIKNPKTSTFKTVKKINAKHRFSVTGTPIENRLIDLFSQFDFLNPGYLGNYESFKENFYIEIEKKNNSNRLNQLKQLTSPLILRRLKSKVLQLPEKTETVLYCEMGFEQRVIYDEYYKEIREQIINGLSGSDKVDRITQWHILRGITILREICASTSLLSDNFKFGHFSIKQQLLEKEIKFKESNHKFLIFSQFLGVLSEVRTIFEKNGIQYEYLDGSTNNRQEKVDNFQNNQNVRGFICSLRAGGVGLNLTAADTVYILDPWWNPAVESQAIDRSYRMGQVNPVNAFRLICKNTIEEKIMHLQDKKRKLADSIYEDDNITKSSLTKDEILMLFS
jgi:non-specific serine/threonine protein kinase